MCHPTITSTSHDEQVNENQLIELGKKYLTLSALQRKRAYNYYVKMKDTDEFKNRIHTTKQVYYERHKDEIREKERYKYAHDEDYHIKIRERARQKYLEKNADIPKNKRGRKPKPFDESVVSIPRPRGRPPINR